MAVKTLPAKVVPEPLSQMNFEALKGIFKELEETKSGAEPTGPAGGVLSGTYPNPGFAADMATQVELDAEKELRESKDKTEKEARETADSTEKTERESKDKTEKEAREAAVSTEKTERESADTSEKSTRESKDAERVVGPASTVDSDVAIFNGTSGKIVKDGGKTIAQILERANHTGTQTASTISDLAAVVKAYLLNEFGKPNGNIDLNEHKIIKLLDPTEALDAANKEYVDAAASAAAQGLSVKNPVSYATTANLTVEVETEKVLEGECPLVIDGKEAFEEGTRILVKDQTTKKRNGIYEVTFDEAFGGSGKYGGGDKFGEGKKWKLTRTSDADSTAEVKQGMFVTVISGATNSGTAWTLATENPIEIGITNEEFVKFTSSPTGVAGGDLTGTYPNPTVATGKINSAKIEDGSIADADLASPNNKVWHTIMSDNSFIGASNVVGTYLFGGAGLLAAAETGTGIQILYIDPVDFEVAGKTLKYRIRAMLLTNAKAPACTFTVGLYPITGTAGISGKVKPTIGAVVAGSTVAFVSQAASTQGKGLSTEFTPPAAGYYAIGVEQSVATSALESNEIISGYLQEHVI